MDFDELQNTLDSLDLGVKPTKLRAGEMMHGDHEETRLMGDYESPVDRERLVTRVNKRLFYDLKDVKKATDHIEQLPGNEETIHIIMPGNYAAFDLTLAICNLIGQPIELLTITTLGYNKSNFTHLLRMLDGANQKATAFRLGSIRRKRQPGSQLRKAKKPRNRQAASSF